MKIILLILLFHISLKVFSQTSCEKTMLTPNEVQKKIDSIVCHDRQTLLNFRKIDFVKQYIYNRPMCNYFDKCYYNCLFEYNKYGIDFRVASYYDSQMRNRILQLLRNDFMEGELDSLIKKELSQITFIPKSSKCIDTLSQIYKKEKQLFYENKKDSLISEYKDKYHFDLYVIIKACKFVYDEEIEMELLKLYHSQINWGNVSGVSQNVGDISAYANIKEIIKVVLAAHGKTEYLNGWKYDPIKDENWKFDKTDTLDDLYTQRMAKNIKYLALVHTDESYYELSKYLLSPRFIYSEEMEETNDDSNHNYNYHIKCFAFLNIVYNVTNVDLYKSLRFLWYYEQYNKFQNIRDNLTDEFCRKMYDWMQENYGNYQLWYEW